MNNPDLLTYQGAHVPHCIPIVCSETLSGGCGRGKPIIGGCTFTQTNPGDYPLGRFQGCTQITGQN